MPKLPKCDVLNPRDWGYALVKGISAAQARELLDETLTIMQRSDYERLVQSHNSNPANVSGTSIRGQDSNLNPVSQFLHSQPQQTAGIQPVSPDASETTVQFSAAPDSGSSSSNSTAVNAQIQSTSSTTTSEETESKANTLPQISDTPFTVKKMA